MKKYYLIMLILLIPLATALDSDICEKTLLPNENCTMLTPVLSCTTYNYSIFRYDGLKVTEGDLTSLNNSIYYFAFNESEGDYIVELCDGSTREIIVEGEGDMIYFTVAFIFTFIASLIVIGLFKAEKMWLKVVLVLALELVLMVLLRFAAWFVEINHAGETALIQSLNFFYSLGVKAFYFSVAGAMIFLVILIVNIVRMRPSKKRKDDWTNWGREDE